jgi:predicted transcriptional regulator of viral defense system
MTAYDLVRYRKGAGSIDHVATVVSELAERMDRKRLLAIAKKGEELPVIQRLGYLLDRTGHDALTPDLHKLVDKHRPKMVALEPGSSEKILEHDLRWRTLVNTTIEVEA